MTPREKMGMRGPQAAFLKSDLAGSRMGKTPRGLSISCNRWQEGAHVGEHHRRAGGVCHRQDPRWFRRAQSSLQRLEKFDEVVDLIWLKPELGHVRSRCPLLTVPPGFRPDNARAKCGMAARVLDSLRGGAYDLKSNIQVL